MLRTKAVRVATIAVAGMYQTSLVSYFIDRDLFPALMKVSGYWRNGRQNTCSGAIINLAVEHTGK